MKSKRYLKSSWLIIALTQAIAAGCTASDFQNAAQATTNSSERAASTMTGTNTTSQNSNVRISRAFFEKSIAGKMLLIDSSGNSQLEKDSNVQWQEYPTTIPAPTEPVNFDFRERKGCAIYENIPTGDASANVKLCFTIVPDVSSLGVNSKEVTLDGAEAVVQQIANCPVSLQFDSANHNDGTLTVTFTATPAEGTTPNSACPSGPYRLNMTLRQI